MITEIEVKNFKTLRDVKIPLAPGITVMVGANNSGKSNALAVLKLLAQGERQNDFQAAVEALGGMQALRSRESRREVELALYFETRRVGLDHRSETWRYCTHFKWSQDGVLSSWLRFGGVKEEDPDGYQVVSQDEQAEHQEALGWLSEFLRESDVHDLSITALRAPAIVRQGVELGPDGRDAAAVLDALAGENPGSVSRRALVLGCAGRRAGPMKLAFCVQDDTDEDVFRVLLSRILGTEVVPSATPYRFARGGWTNAIKLAPIIAKDAYHRGLDGGFFAIDNDGAAPVHSSAQ